MLDGSISGSGDFSPHLRDFTCEAHVLSEDPLTYQITGTTFPQDDQVWADILLLPNNPQLEEPYELICPDETFERTDPLLWPVLMAVEGLVYQFPLEQQHTITYEVDLSQVSGGGLSGILTAEMIAVRG
jgi:hypothetical protein